MAEIDLVRQLGERIGYGRLIQLAHQCWDEKMERDWGIKGHSTQFKLAEADRIRQQQAQDCPVANTTGLFIE